MNEIFAWFLDLSNSKSLSLVILFVTFVAILFYVYGSKKRSERFESYRNIPFLDDDHPAETSHKEGGK
jgi:cbb3-type cytochrome oxidase subunit 3